MKRAQIEAAAARVQAQTDEWETEFYAKCIERESHR